MIPGILSHISRMLSIYPLDYAKSQNTLPIGMGKRRLVRARFSPRSFCRRTGGFRSTRCLTPSLMSSRFRGVSRTSTPYSSGSFGGRRRGRSHGEHSRKMRNLPPVASAGELQGGKVGSGRDRRSDCQSMKSIAILAMGLACICADLALLVEKLPCVARTGLIM